MKNFILLFVLCALLSSCAATISTAPPTVAVPGHPTPKEQKAIVKYNKTHKPLSYIGR
jgi:hypothetical protein